MWLATKNEDYYKEKSSLERKNCQEAANKIKKRSRTKKKKKKKEKRNNLDDNEKEQLRKYEKKGEKSFA